MKLYLQIKTAIKALRRNKLRSMLTALGIVIGIAAVITMMEIGAGSSLAIQNKIKSMGANNIIIIPKAAMSEGVSYGAGTAMTLTKDDCDAIKAKCKLISDAAPILRSRAQIVYKHRNWVPDSIEGTTHSYLKVRQWSLARGEAFSDLDVKGARKVCIIGQTIVDNLFANESPIGKSIRLRNISLKVIGVLDRKGANLMGHDQDDILLAPWTTIKYRISGRRLGNINQSASANSDNRFPVNHIKLYPEKSSIQSANSPHLVRYANIDAIITSAIGSGQIDEAGQQISDILRLRHNVAPGEEDFEIINLTEVVSALSSTAKLMTKLLLCIAAISLLVGGVGIMNVMLVSVTERTREIGIRMAIGANHRDILTQFLMEAIALCFSGGIIGIILGNGVSYVLLLALGWPVNAMPMAAMVAVLVSISVGVVFGFYPAYKASHLSPIEALRYE